MSTSFGGFDLAGTDGASGPILLYDGVCALCNGGVRFILKRDRRRELRFAALAGMTAARVRAANPGLAGVDSMVWVEPGGQPRVRSDAALAVGSYLGGFWGFAASVGRWCPRSLKEAK